MIAALEIARLFRRELTPFECGSHKHAPQHRSISVQANDFSAVQPVSFVIHVRLFCCRRFLSQSPRPPPFSPMNSISSALANRGTQTECSSGFLPASFQRANTNYSPLPFFLRLLKGLQEPITLIEISYQKHSTKSYVQCSSLSVVSFGRRPVLVPGLQRFFLWSGLPLPAAFCQPYLLAPFSIFRDSVGC